MSPVFISPFSNDKKEELKKIYNKALKESYQLDKSGQLNIEKICKKTIYIPITYSRQIPIPINFIKTLPKTLANPLLETAFKYFVNRPNPNYKWAQNMSINNHETIMKILPREVDP